MYKKLLITISSFLIFTLGWFLSDNYKRFLNPDTSLPSWNKPKPLEKYTIENLRNKNFEVSNIKIVDTNLFEYSVEGKKVTGCLNIPKEKGSYPLAILVRGYVDQKEYKTCDGSKKIGEYLSNNGYITLSPDFLGYGGSDKETNNIFESRFQTYVTLITLIESIKNSNTNKVLIDEGWDGNNIFIWAHSNGGQIVLTALTIKNYNYPTVLWAPVVESFPYNVLYFTNEAEDKGKFIRQELAKFEKDYDTDKYSFTNYLESINAPIELHLGTNDDAIPLEWANRFVKSMQKLDKPIKYYKHPNLDHNMMPNWSDIAQKTLQFFDINLKP